MEHTIYHRLFAVQEQFPDVHWDIEDGLLVMRTYLPFEDSDNLLKMREMFSPVSA